MAGLGWVCSGWAAATAAAAPVAAATLAGNRCCYCCRCRPCCRPRCPWHCHCRCRRCRRCRGNTAVPPLRNLRRCSGSGPGPDPCRERAGANGPRPGPRAPTASRPAGPSGGGERIGRSAAGPFSSLRAFPPGLVAEALSKTGWSRKPLGREALRKIRLTNRGPAAGGRSQRCAPTARR